MAFKHRVANVVFDGMNTESLWLGPILEHILHAVNEGLPHVFGVDTALVQCPSASFGSEDGAFFVAHHVPVHKSFGEIFPFGKVIEDIWRWNAALNKASHWPHGIRPRTMILITSNIIGTKVGIEFYWFSHVVQLPDLVLKTARDSYRDRCAGHNAFRT